MNFVLVTGGSRGLGAAICKRLATPELGVIINYRSGREAAFAVAEEIRARGAVAELLPFDVSDEQCVDDAIGLWEDSHPDDRITVLVNNAGVREDNLMIFMPSEQWHKVISTTLDGFFYVTRRVLKGMLTRRNGRIINVASLSGLKGLPGQTNYSAAKAALIGATKALAQEVAARKVTVNAVAPGFINTDMTESLDREALTKLVPLGRFGEPEEVAALVAFLASPESAYITGETISINGGIY
ncbi:MAG: 3-oxoacyl-ACP reductase FabG [Candidatus Amulumruptor caecigallinarius]|nr:3-oxoacyl-ACP reductase FabG [Candidatus Amulumruptor caecigallinarius]MCM1396341.1 3-oxoacyl-ACP reductase FabG [Candidatus Amulumruptor caecigallinarius]MCM1453717.1 3-oxoacyl-ACP reductase FabG [bacterium]